MKKNGLLEIGDFVSVEGVHEKEFYMILGFEFHGEGHCDCCPNAEIYRMAIVDDGNPTWLINEDQLVFVSRPAQEGGGH